MDLIRHHYHPEHLLEYHQVLPHDVDSGVCYLCLKKCDCDFFRCESCTPDFRMHKWCAEQPEEITHPRRSNLKLSMTYWTQPQQPLCNECLLPSFGCCYYGLQDNDFSLHLACVSRFSSSSPDDYDATYKAVSVFQHKCHNHGLILYQLDKISQILPQWIIDKGFDCAWCAEPVLSGSGSGSNIYACPLCQFFLHQDCAFDVPSQISEYFHQPHPLQVQFAWNMPGKCCFACGDELQNNISFICEHCDNLGIHGRCTGLSPHVKSKYHDNHISTFESAVKLESIKHFSHNHLLFYYQKLPESTSICALCRRNCDDDLFVCESESCLKGFRLHKWCAEQPQQITHPRHPNHKLTMIARRLDTVNKEYSPLLCNECSTPLFDFNYCCFHCNLYLHVQCARSSSTSADQLGTAYTRVSFKHTAHHHDLFLYPLDEILAQETVGRPRFSCGWCQKSIMSGTFYACLSCELHLHEACTLDVPHQIIHPFHRPYSLDIQFDRNSNGNCCFACGDLLCNSISFICGHNDRFDLHGRCTSLSLSFKSEYLHVANLHDDVLDDEDAAKVVQIRHFSHNHPLVYHKIWPENMPRTRHRKRRVISLSTCKLCSKDCVGDFYGCKSCVEYKLHRWCFEQPEEFTHPRHPNHKLTLFPLKVQQLCDACFFPLLEYNYSCFHCKFNLHLLCARLVGKAQGWKKVSIRHISHHHDLILYPLDKMIEFSKKPVVCAWCGDVVLTSKLYSCVWCGLYLHEACVFDVPREILHPFHQSRHLVIEFVGKGYCIACKADLQDSISFVYHYYDIDFSGITGIHGRCAHLLPTLKSEYHDHILTYFEKKTYPHVFSSCGKSPCSQNDHPTNQDYEDFYHCVECNISFHLSCILQSVVEHEYHRRHSLVLQKSSIKDDFHQEIYCDVCEGRRNPDHCLYSCEKCDIFDAHIECALNQNKNKRWYEPLDIIRSLKVHWPNSSDTQEKALTHGQEHYSRQIRHPSHDHILSLEDEVNARRPNCICRGCNINISGQAYICTTCREYCLHKVCAEQSLSLEPLHSSLHTSHPLQLYFDYFPRHWFICDICGDINRRNCFNYRCQDCEFNIDFKCVLSSYRVKSQTQRFRKSKPLVFPSIHPHRLYLGSYNRKERLYCNGCFHPISGLTYCCFACEGGFFLHESCFRRFPKSLRLPFHPHTLELGFLGQQEHNLGVRPYPERQELNCLVCLLPFGDFDIYYSCLDCLTPYVHPLCAIGLKRPLLYKGHALYYYERESKIMSRVLRGRMKALWFRCIECSEYCIGDFYRCMQPGMSFHVDCIVPQVVKSRCHVHQLHLKDSFFDEDYDRDGQYCDVCEEKRSPENHVYVCEECSIPFAGHIQCVLPKMVKAIKEPAYWKASSSLSSYPCLDLESNDNISLKNQKQALHLKFEDKFVHEIAGHFDMVDLHPTNPWIVLTRGLELSIWNYQLQQVEKLWEHTSEVCSIKFISRESWIVFGDKDGFISIYHYGKSKTIHDFKAHGNETDCIDVHPNHPYLLSLTSWIGLLKLWNWEKGWSCTREFPVYCYYYCFHIHFAFNPRDDNTFASASSDGDVEIWNMDSGDVIDVFITNRDKTRRVVSCIDFFMAGNKLYLLVNMDRTCMIWDYKTKTCVQTLEHEAGVSSVMSVHPELPNVIICYRDGTISIWNSKNWRLGRAIKSNLGAVSVMSCIKGSNRVLFGCEEGVVVAEITLCEEEKVTNIQVIGEEKQNEEPEINEEKEGFRVVELHHGEEITQL